jgi:hypothetical protein
VCRILGFAMVLQLHTEEYHDSNITHFHDQNWAIKATSFIKSMISLRTQIRIFWLHRNVWPAPSAQLSQIALIMVRSFYGL